MKYDDARTARVRELLRELQTEVKTVTKRSPDLMARAKYDGFINYFIEALYLHLEPDSIFVDYFPEAIEQMIEQIGEEETMHKLES